MKPFVLLHTVYFPNGLTVGKKPILFLLLLLKLLLLLLPLLELPLLLLPMPLLKLNPE